MDSVEGVDSMEGVEAKTATPTTGEGGPQALLEGVECVEGVEYVEGLAAIRATPERAFS